MLDITQIFAWARMFVNYAGTESVATAACETFDPNKPCPICRAVSKARAAASRRGPAVLTARSVKIVLIPGGAVCIVSAPGRQNWPVSTGSCAPVRDDDVPVPPPRARFA